MKIHSSQINAAPSIQSGASYTLGATNAGSTLVLSNSAPVVTIPPNSSVPLRVPTLIPVANIGSGEASFVAGAGVTLNGSILTLGSESFGWLIKTAVDTWQFVTLGSEESINEILETLLLASDAGAGDQYGICVSFNTDGSVMAVGANAWDGTATDQGGVYVYDKQPNGSYNQRGGVLVPDDPQTSDLFGHSVALNGAGDILAVGAVGEDTEGAEAGATYIFDWNGSAWVQRSKLTNNIGIQYFAGAGTALDSSGDMLAIGKPTLGAIPGVVRIMDRSGLSWVLRSSVMSSDAANGDKFGQDVSLSSNGLVLAVGAQQWEGPFTNQGAVYIFDWNGSAWVERTTALTPSDASANATFGYRVSLNGDGTTLLVGSRLSTNYGKVYRFDWNGSSWVETGSLENPNGAIADRFTNVAMSWDESVSAVGAEHYDDIAGVNQGAVYIYSGILGGQADTPSTTSFIANFVDIVMNGDDGSSTFTDGSPNDYSVTPFGGITVSSVEPLLGENTTYFDGVGDYLSLSGSVGGTLANNDSNFNIDVWVNIPSIGASLPIFAQNKNVGAGAQLFYINSAGKLRFLRGTGAGNPVTVDSVSTVPTNQWVHLLVSWDNTTYRLFIDGVLDGSGVGTAGVGWVDTLTNVEIGRSYTASFPGSTTRFTGYMSRLKVDTETPAYTSNFDPNTRV